MWIKCMTIFVFWDILPILYKVVFLSVDILQLKVFLIYGYNLLTGFVFLDVLPILYKPKTKNKTKIWYSRVEHLLLILLLLLITLG